MSEETLLKSKVSNSISFISSLIYLCENPLSWNIIKLSVNVLMERLYYHRHTKSGNPLSPKKFEMDGLYINQFEPRSKLEWSLSWKFSTPSSNPSMSRNNFSLSSSSLRNVLKNPFVEFLQYLFHFPNISDHFWSKLISW
jgi:hypothetical protein